MKRARVPRIGLLAILAFLIFNFAFAEIPKLIQYQGKATGNIN